MRSTVGYICEPPCNRDFLSGRRRLVLVFPVYLSLNRWTEAQQSHKRRHYRLLAEKLEKVRVAASFSKRNLVNLNVLVNEALVVMMSVAGGLFRNSFRNISL